MQKNLRFGKNTLTTPRFYAILIEQNESTDAFFAVPAENADPFFADVVGNANPVSPILRKCGPRFADPAEMRAPFRPFCGKFYRDAEVPKRLKGLPC